MALFFPFAQLRRILAAVERILPPDGQVDWRTCHAAGWRRHRFGGYLVPLPVAPAPLDGLLGIDRQKAAFLGNLRQFLADAPANHVLLWGSRGTGKSTLVRALLDTFAVRGLRLIQVDKDDLTALPELFSRIATLPYHFIIFCDDLSFGSDENGYKALKSALDGSVYAAPPNALLCVTSNRRHLLPEFHSENAAARLIDGEIHHGESVEEKISLADRFGLSLAFPPFDRAMYLRVAEQSVRHLAAASCLAVPWDGSAAAAASDWAQLKGKHCGRTAAQFARHWVGQALLLAQHHDRDGGAP